MTDNSIGHKSCQITALVLGKKDKKISYMLSRQRYAEWLPTALNVTGCSAFSKKRGTGAGHGSRGHG